MATYCPCCKSEKSVGATVGGKLACALVGATIGQKAMRNPLAAIGCALIGVGIGELIDREVIPQCPECGTALQAVAAVL